MNVARYKFLVISRPVEGQEKEYDDWYQNTHLRDVVAIDGFKSAQRFRLQQSVMPGPDLPPYLAIYDLETDDINGAVQELMKRSASGQMVISKALCTDGGMAAIYEESGPVVKAG
jgi:hypothetical protein